ncbi:flagellar protein FliS [Alkaliphilus metalliredigens QYMF]|uniref:Flagellar secretion chaperone FliS n=1 Tax=Alkaliphilus metalliredigens (strain QYMF) TaxID=293826 RepID=A6TLE3_ALKMQ|nr:flagellar export chaperone FliS [Alkaliphilus metalliredigens]ABR47011.1 flagellar protein FliS [Alkaliphilus metalliredigens QYMF]
MAMQNPYQQYKQNSVMTASPQELTLMLYNGALKFINVSKKNIDEKNIAKANESIQRVQSIIQELNITLDMNYEVSKNLRSLYTYILERLVDANMQKDMNALEEAAQMITELRDTWKDAMKQARVGNR